ncbi:GNAT family N-acetyltransferase [Pseudomonas sp. 5P_3.1_Bac2]|uniref:GNAT family N-acetyltransferase n=1 Tax=Pseudomonas sp. 5P_3.1_Bac2 TaxID=2971617 RepID=UPI0021C9921D|nr:GNAT family N-acetyltransferase [Pseudomonas sp. 5P_3.1_Bac2]MCU1717212.1 GNAT family N-acetyltransferase [Pseudomonas sp. 5P_3.1_Bac2]
MSNRDEKFAKAGYRLSLDKTSLDLDVIHALLSESRWAAGISRERVQRSIDHSLCVGLYHEQRQVGFARLVTDYATFGYLCDVIIASAHQGQGLGRWLCAALLAEPDVQQLRRILLATSTAGWLYEKLGFTAVNQPDFIWQLHRPDIYQQ